MESAPTLSKLLERIRSYGPIVLVVTVIMVVIQIATFYSPILESVETPVRGWFVSYTKSFSLPKEFVFVALDDATMHLDGVESSEIAASPELQAIQAPYPWSRDVYASLIDRLAKAGARVIGLDILFTEPRPGDEELRAAIARYPNRVVLASNLSFSLHNHAFNTPQIALPTKSLLSPDQAVSPHVGFVNFFPEETAKKEKESDSGIVEKLIYQLRLSDFGGPSSPNEPVYLSFAASILETGKMATHFPEDQVRFVDAGKVQEQVPIVSLYTIFVPALWKANLKDGEIFRDKIVVIGPFGDQFHDIQRISSGTIAGPLLHILAMGALLKNAFYTILSPQINALIIIVLGLVIFLSALPVKRFWLFPLLMLIFCGLYLTIVSVVFIKGNILMGIVFPIVMIFVSSLSLFAFQYARDLIEKSHVRQTLERYVSRNLVQKILDDRGDFLTSLEGSRKNVAILFSDIRGFTKFSENRDPHDVVLHLNEYLGAMVKIVFKYDGTLDKFVGDAVMAVWGDVSTKGEHNDTVSAIKAAIEMLNGLQQLNEKWQLGSGEKFHIGIGINFGSVIFGNIGSEEKSDLTVIGDSVNLASRIESLTKFYHVPILVGESVEKIASDVIPLRYVDRIAVTGRTTELDIFTPLLNERHEFFTPSWLEDYNAGVKLFRTRDFSNAVKAFEKCAVIDPNDYLVQRY
ncbi:MAG: adenylate/guanylate cyclase domain-containing protein, partial [Chthoniobacterales bacterium]